MPDSDRGCVLDALRTWLSRANSAVAATDVAADMDIIESRILESLQVVEFILFLEEQSGKRILEEDLDPEKLRTLDSIYYSFFESRQ
jgi:acyl carrier protein